MCSSQYIVSTEEATGRHMFLTLGIYVESLSNVQPFNMSNKVATSTTWILSYPLSLWVLWRNLIQFSTQSHLGGGQCPLCVWVCVCVFPSKAMCTCMFLQWPIQNSGSDYLHGSPPTPALQKRSKEAHFLEFLFTIKNFTVQRTCMRVIITLRVYL